MIDGQAQGAKRETTVSQTMPQTMPQTMTEAEFRAYAASKGYGEPELKTFKPDFLTREHAHDYDGLLLVVEGCFTGHWQGENRACPPGTVRELAAGTLHTDGSGAEGAKYLLAQK